MQHQSLNGLKHILSSLRTEQDGELSNQSFNQLKRIITPLQGLCSEALKSAPVLKHFSGHRNKFNYYVHCRFNCRWYGLYSSKEDRCVNNASIRRVDYISKPGLSSLAHSA